MSLQRPFELTPEELNERLEEMVDVTFSDLVSEFLLMPMGSGFIRYTDFRQAYEVLKRCSKAFEDFSPAAVNQAIQENSRVVGVLRAILGMTAPEWAELARSELNSDVTQNAARTLDRRCREDPQYVRECLRRFKHRINRARMRGRTPPELSKTIARLDALVNVAVHYITRGAPDDQEGVIHRLAKFDTKNGLDSLIYASRENVPYAVLLYERYLGRPFAGHRDAVSELVGEIMENAIEERLRLAGVSYRKTGRAERIPGFGQAPDFCIPDELSPAVISKQRSQAMTERPETRWPA